MEIKSFSLGPLGTNCYIIYNDEQAVIIDPGAEGERVSNWLRDEKLKPIAILLTHAHFDHIGAVEELRTAFQIDVYMHENEKLWLTDSRLNGSVYFIGEEVRTSEPDYLVKPGPLSIGPFEFEVFHTPGHSPGSISYFMKEQLQLISGDVLFQRGIGRTDLPGGDYQQLQDSIRQKLYQLPSETIVYPGHGPVTTIGDEKQLNPFVPEK